MATAPLDGGEKSTPCLDARELCLLYDQEQETIDHIIAKCSLTRELWFFVLQAIGKQLPQGAPSTLSWWRRLRALSTGMHQNSMDSLFALCFMARVEGTQCTLLRGVATSISDLLQLIKAEAESWIQAGASALEELAGG